MIVEVDDDDDFVENSLMELAGDMLDERLDLTGGGLFFVLILDGVWGIIDVVVSLPVLASTFFLEILTDDLTFTSVPEEQLLELLHDEDGLAGSVLRAVEVPKEDDFELSNGFGTPLRGTTTLVSFDT